MHELCPETDPRWYALQTRYQHEIRLERLLRSKGWETLVPVYRQIRQWSDRVKEIDLPLFAGYVFCRFSKMECKHVEDTPGILRAVRFNAQLAPIPQHEIQQIQTMLTARVPLSPWPFLKSGDRVRVERGPLRGMEGTLLRDGHGSRLVVNVEILQRSIAAEIDSSIVTPVRSRAANSGV